jgi:hypothetical protein
MVLHGHRARNASKLITGKKTSGTGNVFSTPDMMGRGLAIRKAIIRRAGKCKSCYTSKQMMGKMW